MSKSLGEAEGGSKNDALEFEGSDKSHVNVSSFTANILTQEKIVDLCYRYLE